MCRRVGLCGGDGKRVAGDFYEKEGAAIKGYDPVAYFTGNKPVKGSPAYKAEYRGSVFHFVSQANRDAFAANPAKYAPQYNGFCAFGAAGGYKAAIDPAAFTIDNDKLYLNLVRKPKKYSEAIAGIGKDIYDSNYLGPERKAGASL